ncbi:MAG: NAD-dependent deacylase [Leptospiraceae bacterium]|nr:NAD-dependent deacylase [Leptospiraceae bacterium]MDW8307311.1 NAD-dependent deacylase [Leptospiraceae bacterium]
MDENILQVAASWLFQHEKIAVLTGAGISQESGIPTFRGNDGVWKHYRAQDLATPEAFARNPELVWEWYLYRRQLVREKKPNPAHYALVRLKNLKQKTELITQNVDGLHRRSGFGEHTEMHGYLFRDVCTRCSWEREDYESHEKIPHCPRCGSMMRPGVVWFGESIPEKAWQHFHRLSRECELLMVIGTSQVVYPAAALSQYVRQRSAYVIEINPELTTSCQGKSIYLGYKAGFILPKLIDELEKLFKKTREVDR